MRLNYYLVIIMTLLFSCSENNEKDEELPINSKKIVDFSISQEKNQIKTLTKLNVHKSKITNHGIIWYKKKSKKFRKNLGNLEANKFETFINSNLIKDSIYKTYSFIEIDGKEVYGDTLEFKSKVTTEIKIINFHPKKGFIGDTISILGKNFCNNDDFTNRIFLDKKGYLGAKITFESDSLIKFILPADLKKSKLYFDVESCDMSKATKDAFYVNTPVIDSIEKGEKYVGDKLTIYGKNIHPSISEVWLGKKKADVIYEVTNPANSVTVEIPSGLSKGKIDFKIKVIDKEVIKKKYFNSTTPYINQVQPSNIGFLDTLKIKGKYLIQKKINHPIVKIGGVKQKIITYDKDSLSVVLDTYFFNNNPKLTIEVLDFIDTVNIGILPPKILKFNKKVYNLTDTLVINTKSFINSNNLYIGEKEKPFRGFFNISSNGKVKISLNEWLDIGSYSHNYIMKDGGKVKVKLKNPYGNHSMDIKIHPPVIKSIDKDSYTYGDFIKLTGSNFAYSKFNKIYIDGKLVKNPHNSSYKVGNDKIMFELIQNTKPGEHSLYVEVAGQKSNVVKYRIRETKINSVSKKTGTRRDIYKIYGSNLKRIKVYANGSLCEIIKSIDNELTFKFPHDLELLPNTKVTAKLGDQEFDIGNFSCLEPHKLISGSAKSVDYFGRHVSFSNSKYWFYTNINGVFSFNFQSKKWEVYDKKQPPFKTPLFGERQYVSIIDEKAFFPYGKSLFIYDILNKTWSEKKLKINVKNGVVYNNNIYIIRYEDNELYQYNIETHLYKKIVKPQGLKFLYEDITFGDKKIFINPWQSNMYYFDIVNGNFKNIGRPRNLTSTYYKVALRYKNGKLYFFGGLTAVGKEHRVYEYSIKNESWKEKTPMLMKAQDLSVCEKDGIFYLGLGRKGYGYTNEDTNIYFLNKDPY